MIMHRFLIEGLDQDDSWIMVEDEFYAIAQSYTQHLHYAEYVRRKKEAKAQNAAAMGEIQRPTDGRTAIPKEVQQRKEAEGLLALQKSGLEQLAVHGDKGDSETDDDAWAGTHLHGLLASPRKARSLAGALALKSSTRAAAGFRQPSGLNGTQSQVSANSPVAPPSRAAVVYIDQLDEETASSEDDDLDGQAQVSVPSTIRVERKVSGPDTSRASRRTGPNNESTPKERQVASVRARHKPPKAFKSRVQMLFDDLDEVPNSSVPNTSISDIRDESSTENRNSTTVADNKNLDPKSTRHKDVPTFFV